MLIVNAQILPVVGEEIAQGFLQIENGKIVSLGPMAQAPADGERYDAAGALALPGFIDAHCHLGVCGDGLGIESDECNEMSDPVTPQLRAIDGVNPMDRCFAEAAAAGVTCVLTGPGSANAIGGQFIAMKTAGRRIDDLCVRFPGCMKFALGENPKMTYGEKRETPMTRMATAALIREELYKAREYMNKRARAETDPDADAPDYDAKLEALVPVLRREVPAHFHAHRADDIFTSLRIAKEFDLDITLDHCTEGHLIADELEKEGKGCLVGPTFGAKSKFELKNKCWDTPKAMVEHGLKTAIITDAPVIPLKYLPLCAGLAINAGLDEQEAWKAVTINPAVITGIADRVGSLEVGKDADVVIYKGNPLTDLQYTTKYTLINGQIVYQAE